MNPTSDYTILIVDDQTANLDVLSELLASRGFKVLAARDGEAALEIAQHAQPDLILLDVILPGMDGFEVCRRLKADDLTENVPVIFMTILEKIEDKIRGFQIGAVDYITKPFQAEEVLARVTTQLRLRSLTRDLQEVNETLEQRVEERTAQLVRVNEALQIEVVERKTAEVVLGRVNRELQAITLCNQALLRAVDEQTLLDEICRIICDEAGYRLAWVGYAEHDDTKTVRPMAWAGFDSGYIADARLTWAEDSERGRGPAGKAIRSGEIIYVQDFITDPQMAPWRENALQRGYRSGIALPLKDESGKVFGVLLIYSSEPNAITPDEIRLMEELTSDLAFGITAMRTRTERQRGQTIMQARLRLLEFAGTHSMDELLTATLDEIEALTGSTVGFYHFLESDQKTLSLQNWSTNTLKSMCTAEGKGSHYDVAQAGVWVDCVHERRPVIHNDYAALPNRKGLPEGHAAVVREVVVPIFRGNLIKAIIGVGNKTTDYDEGDVEIVSQLGDLSWDIAERQRAEKALKEQYSTLHSIIDSTNALIFSVDRQYCYTSFNQGHAQVMKKLYGVEIETGHSLLGYMTVPEDQEIAKRNLDRALAGEQLIEEAYSGEGPRSRRYFQVSHSPITTETGTIIGVVMLAQDMTDRREVELKLRRERNLLRTLIDNVPDYIFVKDCEGRFSASNTAHAAIAQLSPFQIVGKTALDVFSPEVAQILHHDDEQVMTTEGPLISEERLIIDAAGNRQWVLMTKVPLHNENGEVIGLVGIARDISARKQAEEALRASEEHLRAVVSGTPVILFVFDRDGILMLLQGQGLDVFGGDPDLLVGKSIFETFHEFIPDVQERFRQALAGEETGSIQTIGDVILDVRYSPLRNKAGEISGIIGVATDITERIKAETLRIELEKDQEIIAIKERLIATISHDFRTPLTSIQLTVKMLESYSDRFSPEQRSTKIQQIDVQIERMVELLNDVLTMSKANAGSLDFRPEPVALRALCEQIWGDFRYMTEKTHVIDFAYDCDVDQVVIDPNLVHDILVNLISNAVKYSPTNGHVRFEVMCDGDDLIFRVIDNGIGIPKRDQAQLFQPFHRATNTKGIDGTGLGLSIVKSYVEAHGGHIEFESEEGHSTTFTIRLPLGVSEA